MGRVLHGIWGCTSVCIVCIVPGQGVLHEVHTADSEVHHEVHTADSVGVTGQRVSKVGVLLAGR